MWPRALRLLFCHDQGSVVDPPRLFLPAADSGGRLLFSGSVSTVGGGFASCRTKTNSCGDSSAATTLAMTYVADSNPYKLTLSAGDMEAG